MDKIQKIMKLLDFLYMSCLHHGKRVDSAFQLANKYRDNYFDSEKAISKLIHHESLKASTNGFVTGLGGFITLPLGLPANIVGLLYLQIRLIMTIAILRGYDVYDEKVKILIYLNLCGEQVGKLVGTEMLGISMPFLNNPLIPLTKGMMFKINQQIVLKLFYHFGQKGLTTFTRIVPVVGGMINGSIDYIITRAIGKYALRHLKPISSTSTEAI